MEKHNQLPTRPQITYAKSNAKVLVSNGKNFYRANPDPPEYYHEKPMTLNAWTQTTNDDFEYLIDEQQQHMKQQQKHIVAQQNENELKLLEKIRVLEENLRVHSELLSQIHATSGGRFSQTQQVQQQQQQPQQQQPQNSHAQSNKPQYSQQQQNQQKTSQQQPPRLTKQHQQHQSYSPSETRHKIASPSATSLINQFQQGPKESIKYTIIAEGDSHNDNGEPIEIQLAEEDGAINLNSSADSGRLEIYIDDENVDVKHEALPAEDEQSQRQQMPTVTIQATTTTSAPSSNNQLVKRRKLDSPTPTMNGFTNAQTVNKSNSYSHTPIASGPNIKTSPNMSLPTKKKILTDSMKTEKFSREESLLKTNQGNVMVSLGPNNTLIPEEVFESIPWKSASIATRRLLMTIFDRNTLATHSMTGKPSPAFKDQNKPLKKMLDRAKIEDILFAVTMKCGVSEKEVRNAITTKCADENKMMKLQMGKSHVLGVSNKENMG